MHVPCPFDVLGIGTVAVDDFIHVAAYPAPDGKQRILKEDRQFGGLVGTALAAAARLGRRCAYVGVLGPDELSAAMAKALAEAGIDGQRVQRQATARPLHSLIVVDELQHTRTIFYNLSGFQALAPEAIDEAVIGQARVLLIDQWDTPGMIRAARIARRLDIPVVADMEWLDAKDKEAFMAEVDHLIVPRDFAAAVTARTDPAAMVEDLHYLYDGGRRACTAVTCGMEGCYFLAPEESLTVEHLPAFAVTPDQTTGCGDVFHGAYAATLARNVPVKQCVRTAAAAAALYASRPNGWAYLPNFLDVENLLCSAPPKS